MAKSPKISPSLVSLLHEKASHSPCTYKVSAIAFDKKGDILGHATNNHSKNWNVIDKCGEGREGTSRHAERILLSRYRDLIKTIMICRIGRSGEFRPITPCKTCLRAASKYNVKIMPLLLDTH